MAAFLRLNSKFSSIRPIFSSLAVAVNKNSYIPVLNTNTCVRFVHRGSELSSLPATRHENVSYPPVTPRWPPGVWGELDEKRAWELYEEGAVVEDTTSLWDKLNLLTDKEQFFFQVLPFVKDSPPRILPYQKFLTKTHLIVDELPRCYDDIDTDMNIDEIKMILSEELQKEKLSVESKYSELRRNPTVDTLQSVIDQEMSERLMKCMVQTILQQVSGSSNHLLQSQFDDHPTYEAVWSVAGLREECEQLTDDGFLSLQYTHQPAFTLRVDLPLPVFVSPDDEVCQHPDLVSESHFIPKVYEMEGSEHKPRINPGFLTKTPFNDPCPAEFGLLTVNCIPDINELRDVYSQQEVCDLTTGCGMISAFGSALTQAHSQGFNWWNDITYPITTQSIVFDGKNISFTAYQLNTLMLWKIGENGIKHNNVCWTLPELPLFESTDESISLNDSTLRTLIRFIKLTPEKRDINMRPYLTETVNDVQSYMNLVNEPVIERPHPPRLFPKAKPKEVISPVDVTREKIDKMYQRADERWDEATGRFVPGPRLTKPSNRIRES